MNMPWGKHKGEPVWSLPDNYLKWLFFQDFLSTELESFVAQEVSVRWPHITGMMPCLQGREIKSEASMKNIKSLMNEAYREAAKQFHPDHGGHVEGMKGVNVLYQSIQERLAEYA